MKEDLDNDGYVIEGIDLETTTNIPLTRNSILNNQIKKKFSHQPYKKLYATILKKDTFLYNSIQYYTKLKESPEKYDNKKKDLLYVKQNSMVNKEVKRSKYKILCKNMKKIYLKIIQFCTDFIKTLFS
jgi:hypothetical protein